MPHTPGPWRFALYPFEAEQLERMRSVGIEPARMIFNNGGVAVMGPENRVAEVDCQTPRARGKGHLTECSERDANARLIAAAPDLLDLVRSYAHGTRDLPTLHKQAMAVLAAIAE